MSNQRNYTPYACLAMGIFFFIFLFGTSILNPQKIDWLFEKRSPDLIQHFIGWTFFRHEPWHFPLGLIQNYSFPLSTSIVYTDSIPLLAFLFKGLTRLLGEQFQYFGLWILICLGLQSYFSYKIGTYITPYRFPQWMIACFFTLSPILLNRSFEHHALMAHWLILASFWLYIKPFHKNDIWYWTTLCLCSITIHAYFTAMILTMAYANLIRLVFLTHQITKLRAFIHVLIQISLLLLFCWILGYFIFDNDSSYGLNGYQAESMNLIAPFRPTLGTHVLPNHWSTVFDTALLPQMEQGDEGFNYFGLGLLFLMSIALLFNYRLLKGIHWKKWGPLGYACLFMAIFSLSNRITYLDKVLFYYPLPSSIEYLTTLFRASGRFFWPFYYLCMFITFLILGRTLKYKSFCLLLLSGLLIQIIDLSEKLSEIYHHFQKPPYLQKSLPNALTTNHEKYKHLVFLPYTKTPHLQIPHFQKYVYFAATHHMTVNLGYFARFNNKKLHEINQKTVQDLLHGQGDPETRYVITNPMLAKLIKLKSPAFQPNIISIQ